MSMTVWIHAWIGEEVVTFVRSLGTVECFQFTGNQLLNLGVDGSGFFELSLNELQGVRFKFLTNSWSSEGDVRMIKFFSVSLFDLLFSHPLHCTVTWSCPSS